MAAQDADALVKISTEAARMFVDSYYPNLQFHQDRISSFYLPSTMMPDGTTLPKITYNGRVMSDAMELQKMFQENIPVVHYEVQSYNCQVINPNYIPDNIQNFSSLSKTNITILVAVSGHVKFGDSRDTVARGFSEQVILAPNPETAKSKRLEKNFKEFLIQIQVSRIVV